MEASGFGQGDGGEGFAGDAGGDGGGWDDGGDYSYDDQGYGAAPAADPQQTASALQAIIGQAIQQQVGPMQAEMAEMHTTRAAASLVEQDPSLGTPEGAERFIAFARHVAQQQFGNADLGTDHRFWPAFHAQFKAAEAQAEAQRQQQEQDSRPYFDRGSTSRLPF